MSDIATVKGMPIKVEAHAYVAAKRHADRHVRTMKDTLAIACFLLEEASPDQIAQAIDRMRAEEAEMADASTPAKQSA